MFFVDVQNKIDLKTLPTNQYEVPENSTNLQNSQQLVEIWWDRLGILFPSPSPRQGGSGAYKVLKDIFETCACSLIYNGTFGIPEIAFSSHANDSCTHQTKKRGKL